MAFDMQQLKTEWQKMPGGQKFQLVLAGIVLVSVFLPWISISPPNIAGIEIEVPTITMNGLRGVGLLSFFAALIYLLWKILPMGGVALPDAMMKDELMTAKILSIVMLSGPAIFILQSGFEFSTLGIGAWMALLSAGLLTYNVFQQRARRHFEFPDVGETSPASPSATKTTPASDQNDQANAEASSHEKESSADVPPSA